MAGVIADKVILDKIQTCQAEIATAETNIRNYEKEIASKADVRAGWESKIQHNETVRAARLLGMQPDIEDHKKNASWRDSFNPGMADLIRIEEIPYYEPAKGGFQRNVFNVDFYGNVSLLLLDEDEKDMNLKLTEALHETIVNNLDLTRSSFRKQSTKNRMKCIEELEVAFPFLQLCTSQGDHAFHMAVGLLSGFYEVFIKHHVPVDHDEETEIEVD